jgi:hypothetical protein
LNRAEPAELARSQHLRLNAVICQPNDCTQAEKALGLLWQSRIIKTLSTAHAVQLFLPPLARFSAATLLLSRCNPQVTLFI